jgi:hypothetical protein
MGASFEVVADRVQFLGSNGGNGNGNGSNGSNGRHAAPVAYESEEIPF